MEESIEQQNPSKILYIDFSSDSSCFTMGTDIGFSVYQTNPLKIIMSRDLNGGIGLVKILEKSNIFCLVGGGSSPRFVPNKLIIWDDILNKSLYEFRFVSYILNCHLKLKYIFVFCSDNFSIINLQKLEIITTINTIYNPKGLSSISLESNKYILSYPDKIKGNVSIINFYENFDLKEISEKKINFKAHESNISILKLNYDGSKLATTSDRGTILRIFNTKTGENINEFRRGTGAALIYYLNFSFDDSYIALSSDHGTGHIFKLNKDNSDNEKDETKNSYNIINYISQNYVVNEVSKKIGLNNVIETSFAQFKIPYKEKSIITFLKNENKKVFVIDKGGNYIAINFEGQEPKVIDKVKFL